MVELSQVNETFVNHNCVHSIHVEIDGQNLKYDLTLKLGVNERFEEGTIVIKFYDISDLELTADAGGLVQFMHLEIVTFDRGHDRVRYQISDRENSLISFKFYSFELL